jgi:hypothetical protein
MAMSAPGHLGSSRHILTDGRGAQDLPPVMLRALKPEIAQNQPVAVDAAIHLRQSARLDPLLHKELSVGLRNRRGAFDRVTASALPPPPAEVRLTGRSGWGKSCTRAS